MAAAVRTRNRERLNIVSLVAGLETSKPGFPGLTLGSVQDMFIRRGVPICKVVLLLLANSQWSTKERHVVLVCFGFPLSRGRTCSSSLLQSLVQSLFTLRSSAALNQGRDGRFSATMSLLPANLSSARGVESPITDSRAGCFIGRKHLRRARLHARNLTPRQVWPFRGRVRAC